MKIDLIENDSLEGKLTIVIEKSDYEHKYAEELEKLKGKVQLKGFRKGKVPSSALKKMYGKGVIADVVNNVLQETVNTYIQEQKIELLGNPLPSDDQEEVDFDAYDLKDFTFAFDIGISPKVEIKGASNSDEYLDYRIEVADSTVNEELSILRRKAGETAETDEIIEENDIVGLDVEELKSEDPVKSDFTVLVKDIPDADLKAQILKLKKGDTLEFDISKIDKNSTEKNIRKYLLKLEETDDRVIGNMYKGSITKVSRLAEAPMDENFFNSVFGEGKASNEEEAKIEIKKSLTGYYDSQAKQLTYREIMENLMNANDMSLPEPFLKRWLIAMDEKVTEDNIEEHFGDFEKNLKWSIIRSNLIKKYDIKVDIEEVREKVKQKINSYMMQYGQMGIDNSALVERYMSNRQEVEKEYEEIAIGKMYETICTVATLTEKKVTEDEFKETVKKLNEAIS